jgi:hypothetical protein
MSNVSTAIVFVVARWHKTLIETKIDRSDNGLSSTTALIPVFYFRSGIGRMAFYDEIHGTWNGGWFHAMLTQLIKRSLIRFYHN